jgi:hypothetical protein
MVVILSYVDTMIMKIKSEAVAASFRSMFHMAFAFAKLKEQDTLLEEEWRYLER